MTGKTVQTKSVTTLTLVNIGMAQREVESLETTEKIWIPATSLETKSAPKRNSQKQMLQQHSEMKRSFDWFVGNNCINDDDIKKTVFKTFSHSNETHSEINFTLFYNYIKLLYLNTLSISWLNYYISNSTSKYNN